MNTTAYLLEASAEIWKSYYRHPFVLGIQNGTLDKERLRSVRRRRRVSRVPCCFRSISRPSIGREPCTAAILRNFR